MTRLNQCYQQGISGLGIVCQGCNLVEDEVLGKGFQCTHFKPVTPEQAAEKANNIARLADILVTPPEPDAATDLQDDATKITSFFV